MNYKIILSEGEDGYIVAECSAIPGCISQGKTVEEAIKNIKEAIELCRESYKEDGKPFPQDTVQVTEVSITI